MEKRLWIIVIVPIIIFLMSLFGYYIYNEYKYMDRFNIVDLDGVNNLMIVAHPDDELLWGGAHLLQKKYLVVCITCGESKTRVREFEKVMNATKSQYIMLGYPDKSGPLRTRDNWNRVRDDITDDLRRIIYTKNWDEIVTHNPDGEYGHIHHKITNKIVASLVPDKDKLYYFGKYYSLANIDKINSQTISEDLLIRKNEISNIYESQCNTINKLKHMIPYENWLSYDEWNDK